MSQGKLAALLSRLKRDIELHNKLKSSADLEGAVAILQEAGFDVSKDDLHRYQVAVSVKLGDNELEAIAGGDTPWCLECVTYESL